MSEYKTSPEKTQEEPLRSVAGRGCVSPHWAVCHHTGLCGGNDSDGSGQNHKQEKQHFSLSLQGSRHFLNTAENNKVSE